MKILCKAMGLSLLTLSVFGASATFTEGDGADPVGGARSPSEVAAAGAGGGDDGRPTSALKKMPAEGTDREASKRCVRWTDSTVSNEGATERANARRRAEAPAAAARARSYALGGAAEAMPVRIILRASDSFATTDERTAWGAGGALLRRATAVAETGRLIPRASVPFSAVSTEGDDTASDSSGREDVRLRKEGKGYDLSYIPTHTSTASRGSGRVTFPTEEGEASDQKAEGEG